MNWIISLLIFGLSTLALSSFFTASEVTSQEANLPKGIAIETDNSTYMAGESIKFALTSNSSPLSSQEATSLSLVLISSYGVSLVSSEENISPLTFTVPKHISNKTGTILWRLVSKNNILQQGSLNVIPNARETTLIESYVGPPTIFAGGNDFAMFTAVPTDIYDNLIPEGSEVAILTQFETQIETHSLATKNGIVWKRIFSKEPDGKIILSAQTTLANSSEKEIQVTPNLASSFAIKTKRIHNYADGNQIAQIVSDEIVDAYGNTVTEGTLVDFSITDSKGNLTSVRAATVQGIATANVLHPDFPTQWSIRATIPGIAQSEEIAIEFKSVLQEFDVSFSEDNRTITVGAIKSYIGQLIPDGVDVRLVHPLKTMNAQTRDGMAIFKLNPQDFKNGDYQFIIECLGVRQQYKKKIE